MKLLLVTIFYTYSIVTTQMVPEEKQSFDWDKWSDRANYFNIAVGALVAISAWLVYITGSKAQELAKAQFEAKTSQANEKASSAKVEAAIANRATEDLKKANLILQNTLVQTIKNAEQERQKVVLLEIDASVARNRQAIAERELLELKEKIRPRELNELQKSTLVKLLSNTQKEIFKLRPLQMI